MSPKSVKAASRQSSTSTNSDQPLDTAFETIIAYLLGNKTTVHNAVNLYNKYVQEGGNILTRRQPISNILDKFENEIITFYSPGISTLLVFKCRAAKMFRLIPDDTDEHVWDRYQD